MSLAKTVRQVVLPGLCLLLAGCESVALMPRPSVEEEIGRPENAPDRGRETTGRDARSDSRSDVGRVPSIDEVVGTVQRVDAGKREIHLRTTDARIAVIKYDAATIVYDRDREKQVDSLRNGDLILVKITRNSQGEQFADLIRLSS